MKRLRLHKALCLKCGLMVRTYTKRGLDRVYEKHREVCLNA